MKLAQRLLPILLLVPAVPAVADGLTDFLPLETKVVFGIKVHNVRFSPLTRAFSAQALAAGAGWLKVASFAGFDPLRDIDEVLFATSGEGQAPPALIAVTGRFDVARLADGARRYRDVPLLGGEKENDGVIALLNSTTVIAGDQALVRAAIDRRGSGAKIGTELNDRITSLRQRYDVWGLGERAAGFMAPMLEAKGLESIDRFQFGMQLTAGLELSAEIHARSSQDLDKLTESLQLFAAMLTASQPADGPTKFDLQAEGGALKLTVWIPDAELKKAIHPEMVVTSQPAPPVTAVQAKGAQFELAMPCQQAPKAALETNLSQVFDKEGNTVVLRLPGKK